MDLINPAAESYALVHTTKTSYLLSEIYNYTVQHHPQAHMISGPVQGQFLQFISSMMRPLNVLEIGTFTGYSALCLATGLQKNGNLHTIELREEDAAIAKGFFKRSEKYNQIHLHSGNALEIIPDLHFDWDIVFIDADKVSYTQYYELVVPRLRDNGLIIADNVLFHGQVLDENVKGKNAIAINNFNQHVLNDQRTEQVFLTIRDGLLLIKKK
ncbi:MAG: O-methyltransferase [Chitinophagaceae bacterium]|nr:O-methyltransferase [Chitinophagaceae bacterium]